MLRSRRSPLFSRQLFTKAPRITKASRTTTIWALALILLTSFLTRLVFVQTNEFSYDETHNLMFGALVSRGFIPYREVFVGIAPFALLTMQWSVNLWETTQAVRGLMLLYGLLGVGAIFGLMVQQARTGALMAAVLAALFFSFNPHYFAVSSTLNLEAAALAFGLLSIWCMAQYTVQEHWLWLVLSGISFGLSLAVKILVPFAAGVILLQMLLHDHANDELRHWRSGILSLLRQGVLWTAGVLGVLLIFVLLYDPILMYQQVIEFRLDLRAATIRQGEEVNVAQALSFWDVWQFAPLVLGTLVSLPHLRRENPQALWIWGGWLLLSLVFLLAHIPLRPRHLVTVLPPLAALSGLGIATLWTHSGAARRAQALLAGAVGGTLIFSGALAAGQARIQDFATTSPARTPVIRYLRATTAPDDCIVSKENRLHFQTDRLSTPYLSEVSTARLFAGLLTSREIATEMARQDCAALVYTDSFDELAPGLRRQSSELFSLELSFEDPEDNEPIRVFAVPLDVERAPEHALNLALGDQIQLHGYDLTPGPWRTGQAIHLSTYWEALQQPETDYRMFIHLVDETGEAVLTADHYPFELGEEYQITDVKLNPIYLQAHGSETPANYPNAGPIPTQLWRPGAVLKETYSFPVDLPPGQYTLQIGLFDPITGARLDVPDSHPGGVPNQVILTDVTVQ